MNRKKELRKRMLEQRNQLEPAQAEEMSVAICKGIEAHPHFKQAQTVLMYMPFRGEVDVRPLMVSAWQKGKRVILPKSVPADHSLRLLRADNLEELVPGAYGILEPLEEEGRHINPEELDLAVVPGVAFDHKRYRLGYGGGYYDRFLTTYGTKLYRIGAAFPFQVTDTVFPEAHDQQMDDVVTGNSTS